ncbi:MAG: NAD(P)-dependent oxidoreductase [Solirubrobacterales bacterium]|nr:NAD(P)-dependent oxidoreductase [Solirubrobacterales bacterium]
MRRVLVTGASGFIGRRALAPLLEYGFEVHAVGRRRAAEAPAEVKWHVADLLDPEGRRDLVERVGATDLLHLAWYAEPGRYWTSTENVRWVGATGELLTEFAARGGGRAVLAGTCAEYDWAVSGPYAEATSPLRPATLYGACKDATRRVAVALGAQLGLSVAWGRIFFLYGPGEHPDRLVASVARALVAGERAPTSEGSQRRDFLHVADVAGAFAGLVASDVAGSVNVASGTEVPVRRLVELVAEAAGRPDLLDVGALPSRPDEPPDIAADVTRLSEEVGFVPDFGLEDGLAATLEWWRRTPR